MSSIAYQTGIPNPPDDPSQDVAIMQANANAINQIIAVDHIGFNVLKSGYHDVIKQPPKIVDPLVLVGIGQTYTKTIGGDQNLFYETGNGIINQLTGNFTPTSNNGTIIFPGGITIKWGLVNSTSNGVVNFAPAFANNCFNVWTNPYFIGANPNGVASVSIKNTGAALDKTKFTWVFNTSSGAYSGFFWAAIGN